MARDGMARDGSSLAHSALIAVVGMGLLLFGGSHCLAQAQPEPAKEQAKQAKPAAKKKAAAPADPAENPEAAKKAAAADVQKALDAAQKSLDTGKFDVAGTQVNAMISKGGLDARSMARALAIRGHVHKKQGKPAQAIADLQSALWLKGGLSDAERANATLARAEAYREAGLGEAPSINGGGKGKAVADSKASAPAPAQSRPIATAAVAARPPEPAPPAQSAASGGTGNFFSNLFGQSPKPSPQPATAPAAAPVNAAVSSWSEPTTSAVAKKVQPAAQPKVKDAQVAAAGPAAAEGAAAAKSTSKIALQLGAVRSRDEAQAIAQRVKKEHGDAIGQRKYDITEAAFGATTFYRVRIGPFTDQVESQAICASIRSKGVDCMMVGN